MILNSKIFADAIRFRAEKAKVVKFSKSSKCKEVTFNIWASGKYAGYCTLAQNKTSLTVWSLFLNGNTPLNSIDNLKPRHANGFLNKGLGAAIIEYLYAYCQNTNRRTLNIVYTHSVNLLTMVQHRYENVTYELNGEKLKGSLDWLYSLDKYLFILPDQTMVYYYHKNGKLFPEDKHYSGYRPKIETGQFILKHLHKDLVIGREQGLSVRILPVVDIHIPVQTK